MVCAATVGKNREKDRRTFPPSFRGLGFTLVEFAAR